MVHLISPELEQHVVNGGFLDCKDLHDGSCLAYSTLRFFKVWRKTYKSYLVLYLVPLFLFKFKKLR